jgi:hypothetical protein
MRSLPLLLALAALLPLVGAGRLTAQGPPLAAQGRQDLAFGELMGTLNSRVAPDDPSQAAQFRIRGRNRTVEISFALPAALVRAGGGEVPLGFVSGDAFFWPLGLGGAYVPFDPTAPWTVTLGDDDWEWITLGGTALPPAQAPLGSYSAGITLIVADLGS